MAKTITAHNAVGIEGAARPEEVRRVVLTASGGPFRNYSKGQLAEVTVDEALANIEEGWEEITEEYEEIARTYSELIS